MRDATVRTPRVFLMDEPLSALDAKLREALRAELKDPQMTLGETFVFVTHDQVEAMSMGDRIGVLNKGELVQVGSSHEIYTNPCNTFVARAVGSPAINLLPGELAQGKAVLEQGAALDHPGTADAGRKLIFGVRPEDLVVEPGAGVAARVTGLENHGVEQILRMDAAGHDLRATVSATLRLKVGETVQIGWNAPRVSRFDAETGRNLRH